MQNKMMPEQLAWVTDNVPEGESLVEARSDSDYSAIIDPFTGTVTGIALGTINTTFATVSSTDGVETRRVYAVYVKAEAGTLGHMVISEERIGHAVSSSPSSSS